MKVKPATQWLNKNTDSEVINNITVVILGVGGNPTLYGKVTPPVGDVQTALDNFSAGLAASADGGPSATANKNQLRLIVTGMVRQWASYVQVACLGNMTNLLLSGFPPQKPVNQPVGPLPTPGNPVLRHGTQSGELVASVNPVFGTLLYTFQLTPNTAGAAAIVKQSSASGWVFTGLTPGVTYTMVANAIGTAGPSGWSNPAILVAD